MGRITVKDILSKKSKAKITMLTCYDYSFAKALDEAGLDMILVGDSLANVVLGMQETRRVSLREMINHTKAVSLAVEKSLVVADMPYVSYQKNPKKCVENAKKFVSAGAGAVKIEWFKDCVSVVKKLIKAKIPVMGHIGLTPQTAHLLGGYKVQGKTKESAYKLVKQAKVLQDLGVFSIVLECIPAQLAGLITEHLKVPTIGIGAGRHCDGQVLVLYDLLGLYKKVTPKFVRVYRDLFSEIKDTTAKFIAETRHGRFPAKEESFFMKEEEWEIFKKIV
ncbi:MAG: 3-methyl-2-oxobutanoate hydroxymethyltransferase [Candidatus Omnitrophota bacterium]|nr:MAG: 3-methyl-2-oxobutanoate hydroxymethyltransferase [Candidatus Omnitrophota bacterium]